MSDQSPWIRYNAHFEITPDPSPWDLRYEDNKLHSPIRPPLVGFGVEERSLEGSLMKMHGIYLIGFEGSVIYVGRAGGSETIGTRLAKHRVKLTGSSNPGIFHPKRWRGYAQARYVENDILENFCFSYFAADNDLKDLEAEVVSEVIKKQGSPPMLNSPGGLKKDFKRVGILLSLPS